MQYLTSRLATLLLAALLASALLGACNGGDAEQATPTAIATATATPAAAGTTGTTGTPTATASGTPAATSTVGSATQPAGTPAATAPPATSTSAPSPGSGPVFRPSVTPTPAIAGQPIASTANIPRALLPTVEFSRGATLLATLPIEVPPREEYSIGLSGRQALYEERGMLFHYAAMARGSFWMKDTHFDLAIAFVDNNETIVDIFEMQAESTTVMTPRADYRYAIEAPSNWYLQRGVRVGDRARLAFTLPPEFR